MADAPIISELVPAAAESAELVALSTAEAERVSHYVAGSPVGFHTASLRLSIAFVPSLVRGARAASPAPPIRLEALVSICGPNVDPAPVTQKNVDKNQPLGGGGGGNRTWRRRA